MGLLTLCFLAGANIACRFLSLLRRQVWGHMWLGAYFVCGVFPVEELGFRTYLSV